MPIRFKYDSAVVVPPSNETTRRFGQNLVMQQQQQKYAAQQAGYDRMFQLGRDNMQNQFQMGRTKQQNEFQLGRDKTQFEQQQQLAEAERQRAFLDEARKQSSGFISDAIKNGEYDPATARKLQQNLVAEAEALGNPQLDATQRAEVLEKIRAERALLAANRMEPPPKPTRDDELKQFLGGNYDKYKDQPWVPDGKGGFTIADIPQPPEAPPVPPQSAQEYYNANEDKFQKDLDATMGAMQDAYDLDPTKPKPTPQAAWDQMQKDYQFRMQALGRNAQAAAAPAGQPFQLPSDRMPPAFGTVDPMTGQPVQAGSSMSGPMPSVTQPPPTGQTGVPQSGGPPASGQTSQDWATQGGFKPAPNATVESDGQLFYVKTTTGPMVTFRSEEEANRFITRGQAPPTQSPSTGGPEGMPGTYPAPWLRGQPQMEVPPLGTNKLTPEEMAKMESPPSSPNDLTPEDQQRLDQLRSGSMPLTANSSSRNPVTRNGRKVPADASGSSKAVPRQQVKVGGKPLAVTPGTLTPQETAARQQIMELPQEQRIAALMPYDPELKGKTLEQLLEDPETKAGYEEMSKQGLTTGNYREDMLGHLDEMLQHNVLRGAGQSPPEAYVGMRADEISDPKAKAEVAKLPRPKSKNDRSAIRSGQLYVDPEGVIRARS